MTNQDNKFFVLDTNVLIHNPDALYSFADNTVVVPLVVVEELDHLKTFSDKKGMHARHVLREIDHLIQHGALSKGAKLPNDGKLVVALGSETSTMPKMERFLNDNKILQVAWDYQKAGKPVFFISKDVNARIKAEALGIKSQDYEKQKVQYSTLYRGWHELVLPHEEVDIFAAEHKLPLDNIELEPNECAWVKCIDNPQTSLIGRYDPFQKCLIQIKGTQEAMGVHPMNLEQRFAFDILMDDSIKLVTLVGPAGTGKTLLALACGLQNVIGHEPRYEKLLVARPIIPLGKDIGYLPGTKDQKLNYWMQPIFDNLNFILTREDGGGKEKESGRSSRRRNEKVDYLLDAGIVEIEAITYIRGRSIPNQYIIIDEAQNLTPHEIKTIISRVGEGTKIVLTGDPEQIDNPYLDSNSNGLTYTAERMKAQKIAGHIFLSKSERSELASIAADVL